MSIFRKSSSAVSLLKIKDEHKTDRSTLARSATVGSMPTLVDSSSISQDQGTDHRKTHYPNFTTPEDLVKSTSQQSPSKPALQSLFRTISRVRKSITGTKTLRLENRGTHGSPDADVGNNDWDLEAVRAADDGGAGAYEQAAALHLAGGLADLERAAELLERAALEGERP
jgi:hypothetical protein